ncbi:2-oxoacid ferredoxin oxidoreductase [Candidatus Bipolaricaulota bacterium]|nr:2-oxoacid ferredoxin oxidoreductase [Candidatus Bipolaricaulota bacterium]
MIPIDAFKTTAENQWCPGCPNFGIQTALKRALSALDLAPHQVCLVSGIGQAAKTPHYIAANVFNGLHGRSIPAAIGIHIANPALKTIVTSGDGCIYGEGGNHLLHAFRRNPDITVIVHDNQIYALTKGQGSPTTRRGETTRMQFDGVAIDPSQMLATAIVHDCTFVARGYAGDLEGLSALLQRAIAHRGLSLVDIIRPCITWGNHPVEWYKERAIPIPDDHDPTHRNQAIALALEAPDAFPIGVLYEKPARETFGAVYRQQTAGKPLFELQALDPGIVRKRLAALRIDATPSFREPYKGAQ